MKMAILFLLTLFALKPNAYVYEGDDADKALGLIKHENVIDCTFYPKENSKRLFYFNPKEVEDEVSLQKAIKKLGNDEYTSKQISCLKEHYREGDAIVQFLKKTSQSKEHGFLLIRKGSIIAIAYMVAIYV